LSGGKSSIGSASQSGGNLDGSLVKTSVPSASLHLKISAMTESLRNINMKAHNNKVLNIYQAPSGGSGLSGLSCIIPSLLHEKRLFNTLYHVNKVPGLILLFRL
jgi:hypothetical protein